MQRFLLGIGLLTVLLGLGLWVCGEADGTLLKISGQLEDAAGLYLSGSGDAAWEKIQQAQSFWQQKWHETAVYSDHAPMDEIDGLFAQLDSLKENFREAAACCSRIAALIRAVAEAHDPGWWNILAAGSTRRQLVAASRR